ncbi:MAG: LON peptidase substrate-binding domain-containing protein [Alphaproteobacteria bacterium]|nr:LON peptidase substrate-binding domain-containing protein [Alphaproteobacteria bacterium]
MTESVQGVVDPLPLFPLPGVVLLPGELLPLHVFEPRYRALVRHVLDGDGRLGIATLQPGFEATYDGAPPLYPEVGVGRILRHQALPDGRSNVLVVHEHVGRITAEHTVATPFRQVAVQLSPPVADAAYAPTPALGVLALQVAAAVGPLGPRERLFELEGAAWVDAMARLFLTDADDRRAYLRASTGAERVARVEAALLEVLAVAGTGDAADA